MFLLRKIRKLFIVCALFIPFFGYANNHQPQIYDCFLFYNEFDILEIRLQEMYDHVDKIVLVECNETFRGNPKPLYFQEMLNIPELRKTFEPFLDKIIHVIVEEHFEHPSPWPREGSQRNKIMQGLLDCHDNDIILISDVDEIVRGDILPQILETIDVYDKYPLTLHQAMYRHYLNRFDNSIWFGTVATRYQNIKDSSPESSSINSPNIMRLWRHRFHLINDCGWHFTSMGGIERYIQKIESFSHKECDTPECKDPEKIREYINTLELVNINENYPRYVYENQEYFTEIGLIDIVE